MNIWPSEVKESLIFSSQIANHKILGLQQGYGTDFKIKDSKTGFSPWTLEYCSFFKFLHVFTCVY